MMILALLVWTLTTHAAPGELSGVEVFERDGRRIPPNSQCAELLRGAEADMGRPFTREEIEAELDAILAETGEELLPAPVTPPKPRDDYHCFTKRMRVLTPRGQVAISELRVGDAVFSVDLKTHRVVENRIARVHVAEDRPYGLLTQHGIEVTAEHPFYAFPGWRPIGKLSETHSLGKRTAEGLTCVPRGPYSPERGLATVFTLELEGEPRNFFVEDLLVHNKIKIIL